jgi:protein-L-isoaspartate(D-aspartate) O-methyltransferase
MTCLNLIPRLPVVAIALLASFVACPIARAANEFESLRSRMVDQEIVAAGVKDPRVIESMRTTPRHEFVLNNNRPQAYFDMAIAIGHGQTISPPFVVAYMTEQLQPQPTDKVLEIGTGSGYQAAVLSPLVKDVYTIEIVKPLGERAARTLKRLRYDNVHAKIGDGYQGWPEHAPFDKIVVTCSPEKVPQPLVDQLREGGRMIVPVGQRYQQMLYLFEKKDGKLEKLGSLPTLFVPMTGAAEEGRAVRPDPLRPTIANGGFEEFLSTDSAALDDAAKNLEGDAAVKATGWHYQRQLDLEEAADAPEGTHIATFSNTESGRPAQALQGMAVDGRKVHELDVSLWVKGENIRPGSQSFEQATLGITFYDDNRAEAGFRYLRPWQGSFDWKLVNEQVRVPTKAREAVIRVGLHGATGELSVDAIRIQAVP